MFASCGGDSAKASPLEECVTGEFTDACTLVWMDAYATADPELKGAMDAYDGCVEDAGGSTDVGAACDSAARAVVAAERSEG